MDSKLSIHFGEDKTKSIPFDPKHKRKKIPKLNFTYKNIQIKHNIQKSHT